MERTRDERHTRIFAGAGVLVLVWIGVYWMWEPGRPGTPRISVARPEAVSATGDTRAAREPDPAPEPGPDAEPGDDPDPSVSPPGRGVLAPEFRSHTVQSGETFRDIARRAYGRGELWSVIARANPTIDPMRLREGMTLRIPLDPGNIQGLELGADRDRGAPPSEGLAIEYIVRPNDSLSLIAQRHYGSARYADLIFRANQDSLRTRDAIRVGQVLRLPPLEEGADP